MKRNIKNDRIKSKFIDPYESIVLCSEIFSSISLIENNNGSWLEIFGLKSSSGGNSESKRKIIKVVDTNWGILRDIFGHSGNMCFDNMVTIKEWHLSSSFDPDFMLGVLGHKIKTGYTESELSGFGEFTNIDTSAEKLLFGYVGTEGNKLTIDVEDFISNETEDGLLNWVFDQIFHSFADVFV